MLGYLSSVLSPVSDYSQCPFCAELPKSIPDPADVAKVQVIVDECYDTVNKAISCFKWAPLSFVDHDAIGRGSTECLKLFSVDTIGKYHPVMACFTVSNTTVAKCIAVIHPPTIEERKKISGNISKFEILHEVNEHTHVQRVEYAAPPVIASRDFCFLVTRRDLPDDTTVIWGCSVDTPKGAQIQGSGLVRGTSVWGWKFTQIGNDVIMTYVQLFDPCGWVPKFIISWLKASVSEELIAARCCINGTEAKVTPISILDCGTKEEIIEYESAMAGSTA
eukprot:Tbor_TRINITY_DN2143_c0_g1::TRINITY_DN2143_c0_g1_i1::g.5513::m.5513